LEERNQMLEERLKTIESEKILLLEENNGLRQKEIPDFDSKPVSTGSFDDTGEYFDFTEEDEGEKRIFSPTLTRKKGKIQNNYFNFLLGALTICVACSGIAIQVGQGTDEYDREANEQAIKNHMQQFLTKSADMFGRSEDETDRIYQDSVMQYLIATSEIRSASIEDINHYKGKSESMNRLLDSVVNEHANETKNYYFVRRNGVSPLRDQAEQEAFYGNTGSAAKLARAGRASREGARALRLYNFIATMLSIFLVCFCLYRFKFSQRWKQNENFSAILAKMKRNQQDQNGKWKELQSKIYSWYSKYIIRKSA